MRTIALLMGLMLTTTIQARQFHVAKSDTIKQDTVRQDSIAADTAKVEKPKKETEYEKIVKKGGTVMKGLFTVRHIEDKYYFEVPDSMLGRLILCVNSSPPFPRTSASLPARKPTTSPSILRSATPPNSWFASMW